MVMNVCGSERSIVLSLRKSPSLLLISVSSHGNTPLTKGNLEYSSTGFEVLSRVDELVRTCFVATKIN